jgi:uroporphyrin-III C-methyltransferase / precorrin-2 dehydrogenase / sirohydrochlorin ferrochelatase
MAAAAFACARNGSKLTRSFGSFEPFEPFESFIVRIVRSNENGSNDRTVRTIRTIRTARTVRTMYPAFLRLNGRRVVLVGGGRVAAGKLAGLIAEGAQVTVVAPEIRPELERPDVVLERRRFEDADLDGAWYVVAAAPPDVNRQVLSAAERRQLFVNAVDDPPNATAYAGGVVRRDGVTIAISTDGRAPALAGLLREALDAWLPGDLDEWMSAADQARRSWKEEGVPMERRRPLLLETLNRLYEAK